jgi:hypothetical protein
MQHAMRHAVPARLASLAIALLSDKMLNMTVLCSCGSSATQLHTAVALLFLLASLLGFSAEHIALHTQRVH